jgi:hypothetical protein
MNIQRGLGSGVGLRVGLGHMLGFSQVSHAGHCKLGYDFMLIVCSTLKN